MQFIQQGLRTGAVALVLISASAWAMDCSQAKGSAEKMVCADPVLIRLDEALNQNYVGMVYSNIGDGARKWLRQSQREWVRERDRCKSRECLLSLYQIQVDRVCELPVISGVHAICTTTQTVMSEFDRPVEGVRNEVVR